MKIMILGESPTVPSGFGTQCGLLATGLAEYGHDVVIITGGTVGEYQNNLVAQWVTDTSNLDVVDSTIHRFEPDCIIIFSHIYKINHFLRLRSAPANCQIYVWLPWEADTLPLGHGGMFFNFDSSNLVHLSEFGSNLWKKSITSTTVIPHCYDPVYGYEKNVNKKALRRKWSQKLRFPLFDDSLIFISLERNIYHKRWDCTYDFIARMQKKTDKIVQLIAHTRIKGEKIPEVTLKTYDLKELEGLYDCKNKVCYTDFDWIRGLEKSEVKELLQLSDFRISTSSGEGFGLLSVESAVIGIPQIINDFQPARELLFDHKAIVDYGALEVDRSSLWRVPNVGAMVERASEFLGDKKLTKRVTDNNRKFVEDNFNYGVVMKKWNDLISDRENTKCWYSHRYGLQTDLIYRIECKELATVIQTFKFSKVVEVGSFSGVFLEYLLNLGIECEGVESDEGSREYREKRSRLYTTQMEFVDEWPGADCVVITDQFGLVYNSHGMDGINTVFNNLSKYPWVFLRNNSTLKYGNSNIVVEVYDNMTKRKMNRRYDLEKIYKADKKLKNFKHEIWQQGDETALMPPGI